jgi:DNA invertase Pin-like site-specific DNA recombinase
VSAVAAVVSKVTAGHLERIAYLYVRQSTLRQVLENTESTQRQYALRQRAIALGWPAERIVVIDTDQGQSGASAADREGFQRLVAEVGMGRAGIVLGLEVSRLARNNADWHRLLEICGMSGTLILDEDGLYDPGDFNDRLLLGLKGTMSEAELHFIRARLRGGQLSKARRGELRMALPVGLVYDPAGNVALDPDAGVQQALRHLFESFQRTGSARAVVQTFTREGLLFPVRVRTGAHKGELAWMPLRHWRVLRTLHNPRYAGAFVYGRRRARKRPDGKITNETLPREQWMTLIPEAHHGYLSWEQFEINQRLLATNARAHGTDRAAGPAREGPALLQGLAICGRCGKRMTVQPPKPLRTTPSARPAYHQRDRDPARRAHQHHQGLAPRRPTHIAQGQRQERAALPVTEARRSAARQTTRLAPRPPRTHRTMPKRCTMKPTLYRRRRLRIRSRRGRRGRRGAGCSRTTCIAWAGPVPCGGPRTLHVSRHERSARVTLECSRK